MTSSNRVFIVDDNDDFRSSVAWMLRGEGYQTIEYASPHKAINALQLTRASELQYSCILLDVRMPEMNGLEFHEQLRTRRISIPVVYMTGHGDVPLAVEAMKKGAVTLLEKPLKTDSLIDAVETAIASSVVSKPVEQAMEMPAEQRASFIKLMGSLTPREEEVLNEMVAGKTNKIIASDLSISIRTVEVHRSRLMKKLEVRSVSELIRMVMICQVRQA